MNFFNRIKKKLLMMYIKRNDTPDMSLYREWYYKKYGIQVGKYTYGFEYNEIAAGTKIGSFCSIASGVKIGLMNHPINFVSSHPFLYYSNRGFIDDDKVIENKSVCIESDVWIGTDAIILPGVHIGVGAVIGANAVVCKDVPPYAVVGGVPAKIIKYRFDDNVIEELLKIRWYEWDDEMIKLNIECFYDPQMLIASLLNPTSHPE